MNKPISAALISVAGTMLSDGERRLIEQYRPLGVSLFARNIESRSQLAELTRQIREAAEDENIIIAVDQEGGRVRRLAEPEFRPYASQYVLGKIGETYGQEEAEKAVYEHVLLISKDLKDCGINMNFAPVLDLAFEETAAVLKSRCFGNDEKKTAAYGKIMVEGYPQRHLPLHQAYAGTRQGYHRPASGTADIEPAAERAGKRLFSVRKTKSCAGRNDRTRGYSRNRRG